MLNGPVDARRAVNIVCLDLVGHLTWFCTEFLQRSCWSISWMSRQYSRLKTSWKGQRVVISGTMFNWKSEMSRVPKRSEQGQVLSNILVDDLNDEAEGTLLSSADDSKLWGASHMWGHATIQLQAGGMGW